MITLKYRGLTGQGCTSTFVLMDVFLGFHFTEIRVNFGDKLIGSFRFQHYTNFMQEGNMMGRPKTRWIFLLSLTLVLTAFSMAKRRRGGKVCRDCGCIDCHQTWLDNNPNGRCCFRKRQFRLSASEFGKSPGWKCLRFTRSRRGGPILIHNIPRFDLTKTDEVPCEACHGGGQAHFGLGTSRSPSQI